MKTRASTDLKAFMMVQSAVVIVVSIAAGFSGSLASAASAFLAGCSVLLGNGVYVVLLLRHQDRPSVVYLTGGVSRPDRHDKITKKARCSRRRKHS